MMVCLIFEWDKHRHDADIRKARHDTWIEMCKPHALTHTVVLLWGGM